MKKQVKNFLKSIEHEYKIEEDIDYFAVKELNKLYNYLLDFVEDDYRIESCIFNLQNIYDVHYKYLILSDWIDKTNKLIEQYLVSLEEYEKIIIFKKNIECYVF